MHRHASSARDVFARRVKLLAGRFELFGRTRSTKRSQIISRALLLIVKFGGYLTCQSCVSNRRLHHGGHRVHGGSTEYFANVALAGLLSIPPCLLGVACSGFIFWLADSSDTQNSEGSVDQ